MLGVLKWPPLLWGKIVSLWRLHQPGGLVLPSLSVAHCPTPPTLTSAQFHRPAFYFIFSIILAPFRTCSLLVSTLFPPLPHFSAELSSQFLFSMFLFTAYFLLPKCIQPPKQIFHCSSFFSLSIVPVFFPNHKCCLWNISNTGLLKSFKM